jgi:hypothetical protein
MGSVDGRKECALVLVGGGLSSEEVYVLSVGGV